MTDLDDKPSIQAESSEQHSALSNYNLLLFNCGNCSERLLTQADVKEKVQTQSNCNNVLQKYEATVGPRPTQHK